MSQMTDDYMPDLADIPMDDGPTIHTTKYETKVPSLHKGYILCFSIFLAFFSVANPFFIHFANPLQSQNLYIGMMLAKGQIPYSEVFTSGGMLYFVLIALSYFWGSSFWLLIFEGIAFYMSGIYFYKLVHFIVGNRKVSLSFTLLLFMFMATLGFGGMYPVQFAMPFLLMALWFLTKYFAELTKDESFILFGLAGGMSMLLEPKTLVFWLFVAIAIIIYNRKQKHLARGFYQLLAIIWGLSLVFYTAGYFILDLQILGPYISQAVAYQFTYFRVGDLPVLLSLVIQFAFLFGLGFLNGYYYFFKTKNQVNDYYIKWLLVSVTITYFVFAAFSGDFYPYHLLGLLPFALLLTVFPFANYYADALKLNSHRRGRRRKYGILTLISLYFKKNYYLPLVVIILSLGLSMYSYHELNLLTRDRESVITFVKKKVAKSEKIYVWDQTSQIYLEGQRKTASQFASPSVNVKKAENKRILVDELLQNNASYIIVNDKMTLSKNLKKHLKSDYRMIDRADTTSFHIYQQK